MNIDVIILTDSSDVALTQRTIDTLHDSAIHENFCVQLVDSGSNDTPVTEAPSIFSQIVSHEPLKPVCPVTKTFFPL